MSLASKRIGEIVALVAIGDGMLALLRPDEHVALWRGGPDWWDKSLEPFAKHPRLTRAVGAAAVLAGVWIAARAEDQETDRS